LQQYFWQYSETVPEEADFHAIQEIINGKNVFSLVVCPILCTFAADLSSVVVTHKWLTVKFAVIHNSSGAAG
jgi:hypothetical protein